LPTRYDDAMEVAGGAIDLLTELRPQRYAYGRTDAVLNPIVEPQWAGVRVLAAVDDGRVALRDEDGDPFTERPEVDHALGLAVRARSAILDGFMTKQPTADIVYESPKADIPTVGQFLTKPFFGIRRDHQKEREDERAHHIEAATFREDELVAFVAIDLLWLDGDPLLEVPLLERKRVLDSVIEPTELVRLGVYVRPPVETWISTWRRLGFIGLSVRAANSRYHPGEERPDWTLTPMPRR
jgi:bifunctional non-homologous end joining protein LigD